MMSRSAAFGAGTAAFHLLASAVSGSAEAQQVGNLEGDGWSIGLIARIGSAGQPGKAQLDGVAGAISLGDGTIAVLNSGTAEIRLYSEGGDYRASLGREGEGPGEFLSPAAITLLPGDTLAVLDDAQRRVTLFAPDGTVARTIPLELSYGLRPFALSSFSDGTFGIATLRGSRPSDRPGVIRKRAPYVVVNRSGVVVDTVATLPGDAWYFHVFDSGASRLDYLPFGARTHTDALNDRCTWRLVTVHAFMVSTRVARLRA